MHLQTWLLLPGHQVYQPILQWHRDRGRVREIDDGKFFNQKEVLKNYIIICPSYIELIWIVYKIKKALFVDFTTIPKLLSPKSIKRLLYTIFQIIIF